MEDKTFCQKASEKLKKVIKIKSENENAREMFDKVMKEMSEKAKKMYKEQKYFGSTYFTKFIWNSPFLQG